MNYTTLTEFRAIADAMAGDKPQDWEWIGPHMSQRMFGITEARAVAYAVRHGGVARRMARTVNLMNALQRSLGETR